MKKIMVKRMNKNILIFTGYFLPHLGGIERYIDNFMKQIVKLGYHPILVTSNHDNLKEKEEINGVIIYRIPIYNLFKKRYPIPKHNKTLKRILKELEEYKFSAIIVNTRFHLTSHIGANYGRKHNIPVYLIEHGSNFVTLDNKFLDFFANRYEKFLTWKIKNKIKAFYGVSKSCSEWLKKLKINSSGVWYNSIEYNLPLPKRKEHKDVVFIYAGRLIKQKGVINILNAFSKLEKEYNNIHLYIAGDGPEFNDYTTKFKSKKIDFLGKIDFKTLLNYYSKSDILLYPPLWPEGLPTSILEAGLMRCCVIATNQGGIKEIIENGKNGIIVNPDSESLYNAMKELIKDNNLLKKYANEINKTIKIKFSWENTSKKILGDIYGKQKNK